MVLVFCNDPFELRNAALFKSSLGRNYGRGRILVSHCFFGSRFFSGAFVSLGLRRHRTRDYGNAADGELNDNVAGVSK